MFKKIIFVLLNFITINLNAQEIQFTVNKKAIIQNDVYKVYQYNSTDSLKFIEDFPNGYYACFNEDGNIIESNGYHTYYDHNLKTISDEYKNYYFYDSLGNQNGFIQMYTDRRLNPFNKISLNNVDLNNKKINHVTLKNHYSFDTKFIFTQENIELEEKKFSDTLSIDSSHSIIYSLVDSSIYQNIYLNKKGMIDSTITYFNNFSKNGEQFPSYAKMRYLYDLDDNIISKKVIYYSQNSNMKAHLIREINYHENGLTNWTKINFIEEDESETMEFEYHIRKK